MDWESCVSEEEKKRYRDQRAEIEKVKKLVTGWRKDWESGKLQGADAAPSSVIRAAGGGPPFRFSTIGDLLRQYYLRVTQGAKLACPRPLLKVKLTQLLTLAHEEDHSGMRLLENGKINGRWRDKMSERRMTHRDLKVKDST